ncbi:transcription factor bHLH130-like [Ipomoea triloba]|uniref:transcription factor bHLH130-like n=1 Tax=Ipomoea triloba TaxID=35885 RepID=UPI00125D932D|nr:transcription factor bHLH130-like [Ipomoea triloba]
MDQTRCQQQQMTSCLTRFRSAPSSYFDTILNAAPTPPPAKTGGGGYARDDMLSGGGSGPNIQQAFARLIATMGGARDASSCSSGGASDAKPPLVPPPPKQEPEARRQEMKYSSESQGFCAGDNSYGLMSPVNPGCFAPVKMNTGVSSSNLTRYNTSPAGFFDQFNIKNGSNANAAEASFASPNAFKNRRVGVDLSPRHPPSSSSRQMASISETAVKEEACSGDGIGFNEDETMDESYLSSFPIPSWDDSDLLSDDFLKVTDEKPSLNAKAPDFKNTEGRIRPPARLSHHRSLPKSSAELSSILQDSVPCRVRAKRGCATHPRSIAERVRRTRISDRMRKLQELVPNMDKQTNTADMLDLAVDYIKDLEQKVKRLADNRAKCRCSNK